MNKLLTTILLWASASCALAYTHKTIDVKAGLSNNLVLCLATDNEGYIWAGTEAGLNRIGAGICTEFNKPSGWHHGPRGNSDKVTSLYYDKQSGLLLVGTESGLDIVHSQNGEYLKASGDSLLNFSVQDMASDHQGGVWLFYGNGQIQHMACRELKVSTLHLKLSKGNRCGLDDGQGHLYIGHGQGGMSLVNIRTQETIRTYIHEPDNESSIPGNNVRRIYQDSHRRIWVGTDHGLALFNPKQDLFHVIRRTDTPYDDNVFDIKEMSDGQLWVASDVGGISIVDGAQLAYTDETLPLLSSLNSRCLLQDDYGNIWVGNHSTGVDVLSHRNALLQQLPYTNKQGRLQAVNAVATDAQGRLWVNGEDELSLWQGTTQLAAWHITGLRNRAHSYARSMMVDHAGRVWMGMEDEGVLRFDPQTQRFETIDIGYDAIDIHSFFEDTQGAIWIGTETGVCVYRDGNVSHQDEIDRLTRKAPVTTFLQIGETLFMATQGNGILLYNQQTANSRQLHMAHGLPSENINQALADGKGGVWLATNKGIVFIPDARQATTIQCFDSRQGLADNQVQAIALDHQGWLWASTFTHISCLHIGQESTFHNYNAFDQQPIGGFVTASVAHTAEGNIAFGSSNGVCYVSPEMNTSQNDTAKPKIAICNIYQPTTQGTKVSPLLPGKTQHIQLRHQQNTLQIVATVDDYAQLGSVDMAYMMKGLQDKWYDMNPNMEVVFQSLPPGNYTFLLKAKLKNQNWDQANQTQLHITIKPPFWRSAYAWAIYLILAAAIISCLFRAYNKHLALQNSLELSRRESLQKQELNEERLRFFTNITHELRTPLTLILGPLEDLAADNTLPPASHHKVEMISKSAERLRDLINQILEFRKTETQNRRLTVARADIGQLVRDIVHNYRDLNRNPQVQITYQQTDNLPPLHFDSEVITTILNNLLSNALKYTEQGTINVTTETNNQAQLLIHVQDTGHGINPQALPHIFDRYYQAKGTHQASGTGIGLSLVKALAQLHQAQITVTSQEGTGTHFTLALSLTNNYPNALHKEDNTESRTKQPTTPQNTDNTEDKPTTGHQQPLILIVEDNQDIRQYIVDSLAEDYQILQATNGHQGQTLATQHLPDIIVSDIMMPKMNGIQMTTLLKENIQTSHIPIILLTAKDTQQDKEQGYDCGADSYITKPFTAKLLSSRIRNILANRRRLAEQITNHGVHNILANQATGQNTLSPLDRQFIQQLNQIIQDNIMQTDIDMPFLTDKMAMSHSTFYRKVKALTGLTAKEYVRKKRLLQCYKLLQSGDYNVNQAASMTGFNQMSHFREVFRKEFGIAPSDVIRHTKGRT